MFVYRVIAYSEASHCVCFHDYLTAPADGPDTPEAALEHNLKGWHPTLGKEKFLDVKICVDTVFNTYELTGFGSANGLPLMTQCSGAEEGYRIPPPIELVNTASEPLLSEESASVMAAIASGAFGEGGITVTEESPELKPASGPILKAIATNAETTVESAMEKPVVTHSRPGKRGR